MVECLVWDQDAAGSSPVASTRRTSFEGVLFYFIANKGILWTKPIWDQVSKPTAACGREREAKMRKNTSSDEKMRNQCADIFSGSPQVRVLSPRPEEHPFRVFFFIFLKKLLSVLLPAHYAIMKLQKKICILTNACCYIFHRLLS